MELQGEINERSQNLYIFRLGIVLTVVLRCCSQRMTVLCWIRVLSAELDTTLLRLLDGSATVARRWYWFRYRLPFLLSFACLKQVGGRQ